MIHSTSQPASMQVDVFQAVVLRRFDADGRVWHAEPLRQIFPHVLGMDKVGAALILAGSLDLHQHDRPNQPRFSGLLEMLSARLRPAARACRGPASDTSCHDLLALVAMFSGSLIICSSSNSCPQTRLSTFASCCGVAESSTTIEALKCSMVVRASRARGFVSFVENHGRAAELDEIPDRRRNQVPGRARRRRPAYRGWQFLFQAACASGSFSAGNARRYCRRYP